MRLVVNIVLVALTAGGPWVCCCATTAALSRVTSLWSGAGAHKRQSARTCCHHTPPRQPTDDRPDHKQTAGAFTGQPGSPDSAPRDRTCPCRDQRQELVAVAVSDDSRLTHELRDLVSPTGFFFVSAISLLSPSGSPCAAPSPGALLPFMSTDERLYAHHVLRC